MRVAVVVVGDLGRSPRMQYHARALAARQVFVDLIGYEGAGLPHAIADDPSIAVHRVSEPRLRDRSGRSVTLYVLLAMVDSIRSTFRLGRAQQVSLGTSADISLYANPEPPRRHDFAFFIGYAANLTRSLTLDAATSLVASLPRRRVTIGGDKGYDTSGFVETLRALEASPHIAQKKKSRTLDGRTTRHPGYAISQRARKRIEEVFGWMKTVGGLRKLRHRGGGRVNWQFLFAAAAYNMVRMRTLEATA